MSKGAKSREKNSKAETKEKRNLPKGVSVGSLIFRLRRGLDAFGDLKKNRSRQQKGEEQGSNVKEGEEHEERDQKQTFVLPSIGLAIRRKRDELLGRVLWICEDSPAEGRK
jgi:hypothetical protein